ncbi:MAG: DUF393 domain-containing protein [Verrucomicrobia bacterium]|nr:DUF393 domain-containing protein [Verrucomicrobiota bacterium]
MDKRAVILFDGDCALCNSSVRWLAHRDSSDRLRFAALQSNFGQQLLSNVQSNLPEHLDSLILCLNEEVFCESSAIIRIAILLGIPWSLARPLLLIPKCARDPLYRWVARNRKRWGANDACVLFDDEVTRRML